MGSWNTLPKNLALLYSGSLVISLPSMQMLPLSMPNTPAMELSIVDLPAPLPPITVIKSPSSTVSSTPVRARFSLTVPILKVL